MSAVTLNKHLEKLDVYNMAIKSGRVFKQWFVDKGLGRMVQTITVIHKQNLQLMASNGLLKCLPTRGLSNGIVDFLPSLYGGGGSQSCPQIGGRHKYWLSAD